MDHYNFYTELVSHRKLNPIPKDIYVEKHHIVPRCMGGSDEEDNSVNLTAREHFLAHYCLWKFAPDEYKPQLAHAFRMMKSISNTQLGNRYFNSRLYAAARNDMRERMSFLQSGSKNSQFGTKWIFTFDPLDFENTKVERKIPKEDLVPEGWYPGRKMTTVKECAAEGCTTLIIKSGTKMNKYCSPECRNSTRVPFIYQHKDEFLRVFKKTKSMNQACIAIGIPYGADGGHAIIARKLIEEEGLLDYLVHAKIKG